MKRAPITGAGTALAVLAAACYAAGAALGYPVLIAFAVGAAALLAAGGCAVAIRPSVQLTREISGTRVTVGEQVAARILVRNTARRPSVPFTAVERIGDETVPLEIRALPPGGQRPVSYPVTGRRRGRVPLGPLTMERRDTLGLFRWARPQTGEDVLWVHPRVHPMRALPVGIVLDYEGRIDENARIGTVTFSSLREYVPGDDPRRIHWRSTARTGKLIVREHVDTTEPTTTVVLDTRADAYDDASFEHAVEVAASAVRAVELVGRPVGLHILGERPAAARAAGAESALDRLALTAPDAAAGLAGLLALVDHAPGGGALVVVTGRAAPATLTRLADQRRRFRPVMLVSLLGGRTDGDTGQVPQRRLGVIVLPVRTADEAAAGWNQVVGGGSR
ncbi:DUF58 domain-containing protein [Actinomadura decatromicini]|uniref:DUF58 domain-containing protein n=1 Tax=Actinomadura decatromicini TaxID=2604572 RepID=A0A5D3F642_9ACTN|nr:DUF58 domain-containing protein [Actinomadura decatromicini]TYK43643.1 DUF58 domain-containing protein [Actinomadura decatromicini]